MAIITRVEPVVGAIRVYIGAVKDAKAGAEDVRQWLGSKLGVKISPPADVDPPLSYSLNIPTEGKVTSAEVAKHLIAGGYTLDESVRNLAIEDSE